MVRLDFLVFGYRKIEFEDAAHTSSAAAISLRNRISAITEGEKIILVKERDLTRFCNVISGQIDFKVSEALGLTALVKKNKNRFGTFAALLIVLGIMLLSSNLVWDIRIRGNEKLSEEEIILELEKQGFSVGRLWGTVDRSEIEVALLSNYPGISWLNINRRGSVAYVEIIESDLPPEETEKNEYANIVAASDCIISEITVTSGYAAVSVGEVVKKGDVLISGVLPEESGGGFCYASGSVKGIVDDKIAVEVEREKTVKRHLEGTKTAFSIKILDFSINIFKIYGNYGQKCDIIIDNENCYLFSKYKLPISCISEYEIPYVEEVHTYSDGELVSLAGESMREAILQRASEGEIYRLATEGEFSDDGYRMETAISLIEEVGREAALFAE